MGPNTSRVNPNCGIWANHDRSPNCLDFKILMRNYLLQMATSSGSWFYDRKAVKILHIALGNLLGSHWKKKRSESSDFFPSVLARPGAPRPPRPIPSMPHRKRKCQERWGKGKPGKHWYQGTANELSITHIMLAMFPFGKADTHNTQKEINKLHRFNLANSCPWRHGKVWDEITTPCFLICPRCPFSWSQDWMLWRSDSLPSEDWMQPFGSFGHVFLQVLWLNHFWGTTNSLGKSENGEFIKSNVNGLNGLSLNVVWKMIKTRFRLCVLGEGV